MVRAALAVLTVALSGCGLFDRPVEYVPYEVKVKVEVPCAVKMPAEPDWATKNMPRVDPKTGENIDVAVDKLTAERKQREGFEKQVKEAVKGCQ